MKTRHLIFLSALGLGTAALAIDFGSLGSTLDKIKQGVDTGKQVNHALQPISLEEEVAIGESVSLEVIGHFGGLVRDEAITHRVNLIGRALARYSDRPELNWHFGVLNSDTVNAFSAPGGYVFITLALYQQAGTDDELAGVLSHEITHITAKHALHIIKRADMFGAIDTVGNQYSQNYRNAKSTVDDVDSHLQQFDTGINKIFSGLILNGFDQKTEFAADDGGHKLAAVTGYAPGGLRAVLQQLKANGGDSKKVFSTHPPLADRIRRLPDEPATLSP